MTPSDALLWAIIAALFFALLYIDTQRALWRARAIHYRRECHVLRDLSRENSNKGKR